MTRITGGTARKGRFVPAHSYEWFVRAELLVARGQYSAAVMAYRQALAAPYEDPLVLARLADALDRAGQTEDAAEVLKHAEEVDGSSEAVWLARAEIAKRHDRFFKAVEAYERAQAAAPLSAEPPLGLAEILRESGNREGAVTVLERFARRSAKGGAHAARARLALALAQGDAEAASQAVHALLRVAPARMREVREAAELALDSGRAALALRLVKRLPQRPEHSRVRLRALLEAGELTAAEQLLATEDPESLGGLPAVARGYLAVGRPRRALEVAEAALVEERSPSAVLSCGQAELQMERFPKAAALFAEAISMNPELWDARLGLARALAASGLQHLATETMARVPGPPVRIRIAVADARTQQGATAQALEAVRGSDSRQLLAARARVLELAGYLREANGLYARIGQDTSGLSQAQRARARAEQMAARGKLDRAIAVLEAIVEWTPEDATAATRLAELKQRAGHADEARRIAATTLPLAWEPALRQRLQQLVSHRTRR